MIGSWALSNRIISDEDLQILRKLWRISRARKRLGYMRKIAVIRVVGGAVGVQSKSQDKT